jgi:DNA end-binding protein Ku
MAVPFRPEQLHDSHRENVERLIREKEKGEKITTVKQSRKAPVIDLMEALKRRLKPNAASPSVKADRRATKRHPRVA